jgi:peptide-methionine (S)-S-oxide reductase
MLALLAITAIGCAKGLPQIEPAAAPPKAKKMELSTMVIGGGCFWCVESIYEDLKGVVKVESGYAGGSVPNPTYQQVCSGQTGHAEVVKITFNPEEVSAADLLRIFFTVHDPTTLNRQGNDYGTQYRSAIFVSNEDEKALALKIMKEVTDAKIWPNRLVTTIEPLRTFYMAEDYHQNYFAKFEKATPAEKAKMNAGYCQFIIEPKVRKFREKYAAKLKKKSGE